MVTKPTFERVEVTIHSPMDGAKALLAGEVDVLPALTPEAYEALRDQKGVRILEQPGDLLWALVPQLSRPPWESLEARRALLSSVRRDGLVSALAPAPAQVASGWLPEPVRPTPTAPSLERLGLSGAAVSLWVQTLRGPNTVHALLASAIAEDLKRAGLVVTIVEKTPVELRNAINSGTVEGLALLSRDTADPARFMNVPGDAGRAALDRPFGAHFDQPMVDALHRFKGSPYAERQRALNLELQAQWFERLPMLPLVLTSRLAAMRIDLLGPSGEPPTRSGGTCPTGASRAPPRNRDDSGMRSA